MTQDRLEALFEQIRALSPEKQEELAEIVEWMIPGGDFMEIPPEAEAGLNRALAEVERGALISSEEMALRFAELRAGK